MGAPACRAGFNAVCHCLEAVAHGISFSFFPSDLSLSGSLPPYAAVTHRTC